jgi:ADP-ribose pyrophosphatase YjhB (NUDIX family)
MGIPTRARPCAFVFLRSGDRIVCAEMFEEEKGTFYRPPGGGIEFGEHSRDAAVREIREEFDLELDRDTLTLLGVIENRFRYRDEPGHEICFIYEARVDDAVIDKVNGVQAHDVPASDVEIARAFDLPDLLALSPVYPDGVQALLTAE